MDWSVVMVRRFSVVWPALLVVGMLVARGRAEELPEDPLPPLVTSADTIVLAVPKEGKWVVEQVLQGSGLKVGEAVPRDVLGTIPLAVPMEPPGRGTGAKERDIVRALVFLRPREVGRGRQELEPILSGVRLQATDGRVLRPVQLMNPGGYSYVPILNCKWEDTVKFVTTLLGDAAKAREMKAIPEAVARNRAILKWLTEHETEIHDAGEFWDDASEPVDYPGWAPRKPAPRGARSWGSLPAELFGVITATDLPEDVWQAAKLWQEIYPSGRTFPPGCEHSPAFLTPQGREMLLGMATDPKAKLADRRLAIVLPQIGLSAPDPRKDEAGYRRERAAYIKRMAPLINDPDDVIRLNVFRYLADACHVMVYDYKPYWSTEALEPLVARYAVEPPGYVQLALAKAIVQVGGEEAWQKLTGNPKGFLGRLSQQEWDPKTRVMSLGLNVEGSYDIGVYAPPTARAERWVKGKVAESRTLTPAFAYLSVPWAQGWGPSHGGLMCTLDLSGLARGEWRIRMEGVMGKSPETQAWVSEPVGVTLE